MKLRQSGDILVTVREGERNIRKSAEMLTFHAQYQASTMTLLPPRVNIYGSLRGTTSDDESFVASRHH